jgi:hypothetical protein
VRVTHEKIPISAQDSQVSASASMTQKMNCSASRPLGPKLHAPEEKFNGLSGATPYLKHKHPERPNGALKALRRVSHLLSLDIVQEE